LPLRLALDYRPALHGRAGIGRAVRELARALADEPDVELHLFAHSLAAARSAVAPPPRARLHRLPIPGRSLPWLQRLGIGADRLGGNPAVFHWTDYVHPPLSRARIALTVHDLAFLRDPAWHGGDAPALRARTERAVRAAGIVIAPSQATAGDLRALQPARVAVIPFGADHVPAVTAPHPLGGEPYALCLGTIEPRKNHRALLQAWRRLPPSRPLLVVMGRRGWADDAIVQELEQAGREGLARWLRAADDAAAFRWLAHARLLVYPSLWEGFGFPPLEAMALGVPVVAHDCAPMRELTDGAAMLCDARDPAALAAMLEQALGDRCATAQFAAAGRARAAGFRWRACARAHVAAYREVAQ
jgi:alpha-1,3-rhamnosyl/mannosyltransferase